MSAIEIVNAAGPTGGDSEPGSGSGSFAGPDPRGGTMGLISPKTGLVIYPEDYYHSYTYDGSNNLLTDKFTDVNQTVWTKTFTYTGTLLQGASAWVATV